MVKVAERMRKVCFEYAWIVSIPKVCLTYAYFAILRYSLILSSVLRTLKCTMIIVYYDVLSIMIYYQVTRCIISRPSVLLHRTPYGFLAKVPTHFATQSNRCCQPSPEYAGTLMWAIAHLTSPLMTASRIDFSGVPMLTCWEGLTSLAFQCWPTERSERRRDPRIHKRGS